jgi:hypothetical protein
LHPDKLTEIFELRSPPEQYRKLGTRIIGQKRFVNETLDELLKLAIGPRNLTADGSNRDRYRRFVTDPVLAKGSGGFVDCFC